MTHMAQFYGKRRNFARKTSANVIILSLPDSYVACAARQFGARGVTIKLGILSSRFERGVFRSDRNSIRVVSALTVLRQPRGEHIHGKSQRHFRAAENRRGP